ncbi:MAG: hypothetical protein CL927_05075 [Deltaproteobacteria bacterium]|nr:hypothetical protein [Deltaproteobacteria bacterium]HCH64790.1 hypothetical protein [Deltaproteobacteria bacterium]
MRFGVLVFFSAVITGCNRDIKSPFPAGLEPLEANKASWPSGAGYPEQLSCRSGTAEEADLGEYTWVHCKTYVNHSIEAVFDAYQRPRVMTDRRAVNEIDVEWDVEPAYEVSYKVSHVVYDPITVEFDYTWRHGDVDGYEDEFTEAGTRWQKTFGTEFIELIRGSIRTTEVDEQNTGLELVLHQKTAREDEPLMMEYLRDMLTDIRAATDGDDLPSYESGV